MKTLCTSSLLPFFLENENLKKRTYYQMGGIARYFALPRNIFEIQQTLLWCEKKQMPCAVLGSGSNSVYADGLFEGVVLSLEHLASWHWETESILFAEAGVSNTELAEICLDAERAGAAWMYRMPGQIGASIRMNARCYGGEMSQIVSDILAMDVHGILKIYSAQDIFQGYKNTFFMQNPEIILGARFFFPQKQLACDLIQDMERCEADRHAKNHFYYPSCGSTFKNNYEVGRSSGQIFDELGFKGRSLGAVAVSSVHANFIWNLGNATTTDMLTLAAAMRLRAQQQLQVCLDLEVQPVGLFSKKLYTDCGMNALVSHRDQGGKYWVGLLSSFSTRRKRCVERTTISFPRQIFAFPFFEYFQNSHQGLPPVKAQIFQLRSVKEARQNPHCAFLKWETCVENVLPEKIFCQKEDVCSLGVFTEGLWNLSVSEIFFAQGHDPASHYFEFEMTPGGSWLALEFRGIRQRSARNQRANKKIWSGVTLNHLKSEQLHTNQLCHTFGMDFSFEQMKPLFNDEKEFILMQCALSLGDCRYFLSPSWKLGRDLLKNKSEKKCFSDFQKANFHQPERYWRLRLF
jgi:UDP-N-acetylmuramate dehydrogenase